jgi:hypothetical protein
MKQTQNTQTQNTIPPSSNEVITCNIELLPEDVIKYMVGFLDHDDALRLNQTCKILHKYVPHKCLTKRGQIVQQRPNLYQCSLYDLPMDFILPMDLIQRIVLCSDYVTGLSVKYICKKFYKGINIPCLQLTSVPDERSKKDESAQERNLLLRDIFLTRESVNRISEYHPKLECLLIDYSCNWQNDALDFETYPYLWKIFVNFNVSNLPKIGYFSTLRISGSSTIEHLNLHISSIDPVTSQIIPDMYEKKICLFLDNFPNFNCW